MKTNELTGAALDWAVAKCEGVPVENPDFVWAYCASTLGYSNDWALGGQIIEREMIELTCFGGHWGAQIFKLRLLAAGQTPLIAAMRCYVASKLGDDVEVPEELA